MFLRKLVNLNKTIVLAYGCLNNLLFASLNFGFKKKNFLNLLTGRDWFSKFFFSFSKVELIFGENNMDTRLLNLIVKIKNFHSINMSKNFFYLLPKNIIFFKIINGIGSHYYRFFNTLFFS